MPTTRPRPSHIGSNIRTLREAKAMSQLALAHAIGWAGDDVGAQISRYESGQRQPMLSTLERIAAALGVTVSKLMAHAVKK